MQIDIATCLKRLNTTYDDRTNEVMQYGLKVLTKQGVVRELHGRKNVKSPKQGLKKELEPRGKMLFNLNYHGLVQMWDEEIKDYRAIKAACILQFQDHNSKVWQDVIHN